MLNTLISWFREESEPFSFEANLVKPLFLFSLTTNNYAKDVKGHSAFHTSKHFPIQNRIFNRQNW